MWIGLSILMVGSQISRIYDHMATGNTGRAYISGVTAATWILIGAFYLWILLFGRVEITETEVRSQMAFSSHVFLLSNIIGIRPAFTDGGRLIAKSVELEIARLSPDIYPHEYVKVQVDDPARFAQELHERVPSAAYEPVGTKLESSIA